MGIVSTNVVEHEGLLRKFIECGMEKLSDDSSNLLDRKQKVFLDGDWIGTCKDSSSFVAKLRRKRRRMDIPFQVILHAV